MYGLSSLLPGKSLSLTLIREQNIHIFRNDILQHSFKSIHDIEVR